MREQTQTLASYHQKSLGTALPVQSRYYMDSNPRPASLDKNKYFAKRKAQRLIRAALFWSSVGFQGGRASMPAARQPGQTSPAGNLAGGRSAVNGQTFKTQRRDPPWIRQLMEPCFFAVASSTAGFDPVTCRLARFSCFCI
ncbi:hypothetical protein SUGI_1101480 [Cryptomeria japonica]|nr:hypothetical protein SUGI_1101480 [Cryptomeria japonica]